MPEISVDLPKTKYGYTVQAEEVFWVRQGILRSTDLRDSLDEQVIADVAACILSEKPVDRSKDTLDRIYDPARQESARIGATFAAYGAKKLNSEIKYCIEAVDKITLAEDRERSLRSIVFRTRTTNAFPTVFSTIFLAIHELSFKDGLLLANAGGVRDALTGLHSGSQYAPRCPWTRGASQQYQHSQGPHPRSFCNGRRF
jgi:hypothetical protein